MPESKIWIANTNDITIYLDSYNESNQKKLPGYPTSINCIFPNELNYYSTLHILIF